MIKPVPRYFVLKKHVVIGYFLYASDPYLPWHRSFEPMTSAYVNWTQDSRKLGVFMAL